MTYHRNPLLSRGFVCSVHIYSRTNFSHPKLTIKVLITQICHTVLFHGPLHWRRITTAALNGKTKADWLIFIKLSRKMPKDKRSV